MSVPTHIFVKDVNTWNIIFKAFHFYAKDGLDRSPQVTNRLAAIIFEKFPNYDEKLIKKFALSRTIFRMRNLQRNK